MKKNILLSLALLCLFGKLFAAAQAPTPQSRKYSFSTKLFNQHANRSLGLDNEDTAQGYLTGIDPEVEWLYEQKVPLKPTKPAVTRTGLKPGGKITERVIGQAPEWGKQGSVSGIARNDTTLGQDAVALLSFSPLEDLSTSVGGELTNRVCAGHDSLTDSLKLDDGQTDVGVVGLRPKVASPAVPAVAVAYLAVPPTTQPQGKGGAQLRGKVLNWLHLSTHRIDCRILVNELFKNDDSSLLNLVVDESTDVETAQYQAPSAVTDTEILKAVHAIVTEILKKPGIDCEKVVIDTSFVDLKDKAFINHFKVLHDKMGKDGIVDISVDALNNRGILKAMGYLQEGQKDLVRLLLRISQDDLTNTDGFMFDYEVHLEQPKK